MEYLIRFIQMHESFRQPETDALSTLFDIDLEWVTYSESVGISGVRGEGQMKAYVR
jgi:tRNA (guanine10-N2)-methyltransferase